jgi:hypothetical protein
MFRNINKYLCRYVTYKHRKITLCQVKNLEHALYFVFYLALFIQLRYLNCSHDVTLTGRMTENDDLRRIRKEVVVSHFKV